MTNLDNKGGKRFLRWAQIFLTMPNTFTRCPTRFSKWNETFSMGTLPPLCTPTCGPCSKVFFVQFLGWVRSEKCIWPTTNWLRFSRPFDIQFKRKLWLNFDSCFAATHWFNFSYLTVRKKWLVHCLLLLLARNKTEQNSQWSLSDSWKKHSIWIRLGIVLYSVIIVCVTT